MTIKYSMLLDGLDGDGSMVSIDVSITIQNPMNVVGFLINHVDVR